MMLLLQWLVIEGSVEGSEMNKSKWKEDPRVIDLFERLEHNMEEMFWIGCGTVEQANEGFKLLNKRSLMYKELGVLLEEYNKEGM